MKKNNKKGFILAEVIAVSVVIMVSLVIIYTQFMYVSKSYSRTFTYNSVNNLYLVNNVKNFINNDGLSNLINGLNDNYYIDITSCPNEYFTEYAYCETLMDNLGIKQILFSNANLDDLKNNLDGLSEKMKQFINYINYKDENNYRLIVEFNDETYATLLVGDNNEIGGDVALVGDPIIEKAKELVYSNDACKTDGTTYQYMGGCYIKGNPNNNYIWYSGFLWRIMGINADGTVRLITDENVTTIPWGADDTAQNWDESYAKDWLNNYFYSRLKGNNIIKEETWCSETTTSSSSARTTCTNNLSTETAKVGLITIDEYNLAGGSSSYLNIGQYQWIMTSYSSSDAWGVDESGFSDGNSVSSTAGLRAVINVNSNVTITGGNGTLGATWSSQAGPYILNEDKNVEVTGKLNEKSTSGEYVLFAEKKYRVVDKDSTGNTKLILDGYYEETSGTIYNMSYGSNNTFSTTTGIGQKLNGDVLNWLTNNNETEKGKLVTNYTWYQNNFYYGQSYTISLKEENPTRSIQATVGLIRIGEMLSSQSSSILTNGYQDTSSYNNAYWYWTMTLYTSSSYAWRVTEIGYSYFNSVSIAAGLRAVIVVNSDVTITGGNGTWSNPYQI